MVDSLPPSNDAEASFERELDELTTSASSNHPDGHPAPQRGERKSSHSPEAAAHPLPGAGLSGTSSRVVAEAAYRVIRLADRPHRRRQTTSAYRGLHAVSWRQQPNPSPPHGRNLGRGPAWKPVALLSAPSDAPSP